MKPDKDKLPTAPEWIARLAEDELTRPEKAALADWLCESPLHVREFLELTLLREDLKAVRLDKEQIETWVRDARAPTAVALSSAMARNDISLGISAKDKLETGEFKETSATNKRAPWSWPRIWALAASTLVMLTGVGAHYWWNLERYSTGFGEQKIITLADGSVVTLNTSSELKVDFEDDKRALKLVKGEAYFRVAHDPSRPFEVTAQDATVKAIGTQFNVRIAPTATVVSVLDGVVEVRDRAALRPAQEGANAKPVVRLEKGEEARILREPVVARELPMAVMQPERAAVTRSAAWIKGRVEFEDTPLEDVLSEFRRYREFRVEIEEPLRRLKLTGSFDAQDPESAFAYIETLPGVTVEREAPQAFVVRQDKAAEN